MTVHSKTVLDFLPQLQEALEYAGGTHGVSDVARMVLAGEAQLWVEGDGMMVTEIEKYPVSPVLRCWLAAGELQDVLNLLPRVYDFGRKRGCEKVVMLGRKGWKRILAREGWEDTQLVQMERDLSG